MQPFSKESGVIHSIQDFFPYMQFIIGKLVEGDLQSLAGKGYSTFEGLQNMVSYRREVYFRKSGQIEENSLPGLFWFIIPPDHALEQAFVNAYCLEFDESNEFFIQRCQEVEEGDDEYEFSIQDVLEKQTLLPNSSWNIELPMWDQNGETQLTLRLQVRIESGNPSFSIMDLEVM